MEVLALLPKVINPSRLVDRLAFTLMTMADLNPRGVAVRPKMERLAVLS